MAISWLSKLKIWISSQIYEYDLFADKFIEWLMENGEPIRVDTSGFVVFVKVFDDVYRVWIANFPYGDLSSIWKEGNRLHEETILKGARPSKKVKIQFYEWLNGYNIPMDPIDQRNRIFKKY